MAVICVIGDVIKSRNISRREAFQVHLERALKRLNGRKDILSPYTITLGDEFQAVYKNADRLFRDFWYILEHAYPIKVRFSVGVGNLKTAINHKSALGMDGPAFHWARRGIIDMKRSPALFRIQMVEGSAENWMNSTLDLISHISRHWKRNRFLILERMLDGAEPAAIARRMKLTGAAVYKNIDAGGLRVIMQLTEEISARINERIARR